MDLLSPAKVRITDREYWAQRRGQAELDKKNAARIASGELPGKTVYETGNTILRRQIKAVMDDSRTYDEFCQKLLGEYGILTGESRGRINYLPANRAKPIRGRTLGADFEKEAIEEFFRQKAQKAHIADPEVASKTAIQETSRKPMSLIMQLQVIVKEQEKPYTARSAKIRSLKDMASTLAFCQENNIGSQEELEDLLKATHEDYLSKKDIHAATVTELKETKDILRLTKQRHQNKKTYLEFMNARNKPRYRAKHESEIVLYETATKELKKLLNGKPIPSEKKTSARIRELVEKKNEEYEELSRIRRREKSLTEKVLNVRSIYQEKSNHKEKGIEI